MKKWLFLALVLTLIVIALPRLVTSRLVVPLLQSEVGGQWTIQESQLRWFGPQLFRSILFEREGERIELEELVVDDSLFTFLFQQKVHALSFKGLKAQLKETLSLHEMAGHYQARQLTLHGKTSSQGVEGAIHITGAIPLTLSWKEILKDLQEESSFEMVLTHFPIEVLDVLNPHCQFSYVELLGPQIDLSLKRNGADVTLKADSSTVQAALHVAVTPTNISVPEEGHIYFQMANSPLLLTLERESRQRGTSILKNWPLPPIHG